MSWVLGGELAVMLLAVVVFVVRYALVDGWWRTPAGRHMMGLTGSLGVFFGALAVEWLVADLAMIVWVVVLGALDVLLCSQVVLLVRAQRAGEASRLQTEVGDGA